MHVWVKSVQLGTVKPRPCQTPATKASLKSRLPACWVSQTRKQPASPASPPPFSPDFDGTRTNGIHYSSPTIAGFVLSASWFHDVNANTNPGEQESDGWAVALRYAGEFGAIRVAAGVAYYEESKGTGNIDEDGIQGSVSVMHTPSGLFVNFGAADQQNFRRYEQQRSDQLAPRSWYQAEVECSWRDHVLWLVRRKRSQPEPDPGRHCTKWRAADSDLQRPPTTTVLASSRISTLLHRTSICCGSTLILTHSTTLLTTK